MFSTLLFFENHADTAVPELLSDLAPELKKRNYAVLLEGMPHELSIVQYIQVLEKGIAWMEQQDNEATEFLRHAEKTMDLRINFPLYDIPYQDLLILLKLYVSNKHFVAMAEAIKNLPAKKTRLKILQQLIEVGIKIVGADIAEKEYIRIHTPDPSGNRPGINETFKYRNEWMVQRIKLQKKDSNILFWGGMKHQMDLVRMLLNEDPFTPIHHYIVYNPDCEFARLTVERFTLQQIIDNNCIRAIRSPDHQKTLKEEILRQLQLSLKVEEIVGGNQTSRWLSNFFKIPFKLFKDPSTPYQVNAAIEIGDAQQLAKIRTAIQPSLKVSSFFGKINQRTHFLIPKINNSEIGEEIWKMLRAQNR